MRLFQYFTIASLLLMSVCIAAATELPYTTTAPVIDGNLDDQAYKDIPWQSGFRLYRTFAPALNESRFKILYDKDKLYFAIEADEKELDQLAINHGLRRDSMDFWLNDSVELNIINNSKLNSFYKLIISSDGKFQAWELIDDNTGRNTYTPFPQWDSHAEVKTAKAQDKYIIECAIPLGSLNFKEGDDVLWRMNLSRNRHAGAAKEFSSFTKTTGSATPNLYPTFHLPKLDLSQYQVKIANVNSKTFADNNEIGVEVAFDVLNNSGRFRIFDVQTRLYDENFDLVTQNSLRSAIQNERFDRQLCRLQKLKAGKYYISIDLYSSTGSLLKNFFQELKIEYQPLKIIMSQPAYRNNIYATMPTKTIEAEIIVDTGTQIDAVTATLSDEQHNVIYSQEINIRQNQNKFKFDAKNLKDGDYFLTITSNNGLKAQQRIRKLPYRKGEVWLDKSGITHVDGKRFLPYGWFIFTDTDSTEPVFNSRLCYNIGYASIEEFKQSLSSFEKRGMKTIPFPFQEFTGEHRWTLFKHADRSGSLSKEQRNHLEKTIPTMSEASGILGWYFADEPESRNGNNPQWFAQGKELMAELDPYHPTLMLNWGVSGMRQFYEGCDILIPDCYLQYFEDGSTSKPRWAISDYMKTAAELNKPVWLVPQAFSWPDLNKDGKTKGVPPTFDEFRAEIYQALIGNCKGFQLYDFPETRLFASLSIAPSAVGDELMALKDILLENTVIDGVKFHCTPENKHFQVGLKRYGNVDIIIAVNTVMSELTVEFQLQQPISPELFVVGENRKISIVSGKFSDTFSPGATHVYINEQKLADSVKSLTAVRRDIEVLRAGRIKPGNIVAVGERLTQEYLDFAMDKLPTDVAKIKASSDSKSWFSEKSGSLYYLFDGITEKPALFMTWSPVTSDNDPWLEITLPADKMIDRVLLYSGMDSHGKAKLAGATLTLITPSGTTVTAEFKKIKENVFEAKIQPQKTKNIQLKNIRLNSGVNGRALTEIEVYKAPGQ